VGGELDLESGADRGQPGDRHRGPVIAANDGRVDEHDPGELRLGRVPWLMMPPERLRHGGRCVVEESHTATVGLRARSRNWFYGALNGAGSRGNRRR
jgi:hypothetical protein